MKKTQVVLLFGGNSPEYEVSLRSAAAVLRAVDTEEFDVKTIGITREGVWYLFRGTPEEIEGDRWWRSPSLIPINIALRGEGSAILARENAICPDVILPVLHGRECEDGTLQGLLTLLHVPFVGCGCAASALCMDKALTRRLLTPLGIPMARCVTAESAEATSNPDSLIERVEKEIGYPVFVKPANSGSSVGASAADCRDALRAALRTAFAVDSRVLAEEYIEATEAEVAVLEQGGSLTVSDVGGIDNGGRTYDYDAKYRGGSCARLLIPCPLSDAARKEIRGYAARIFRTLGCRHLARVDFFVTRGGRILFNEINTLPGFTSISMYPRLMQAAGFTLTDLITSLLRGALAEVRYDRHL